jgi:hypothetical protein
MKRRGAKGIILKSRSGRLDSSRKARRKAERAAKKKK